ncbi:hypothetical protein [Phocaeicola sp.]
MKEKKITFRYDTLCITDGRYEFKKIHKRPWGVMLCGVFNMRFVITLILAIFFFVFCIPVLGGHLNVFAFCPVVFPVIFLSVMDYYEKHRNLIIQREDIQSMSVKNNTLLIFYRKENNKTTSAVKQVELKSDMLPDEVLESILQ